MVIPHEMSTEQHPLSWIPEILNEIFLQTDISTLLTLQLVCRQWYTIIKELEIYKELRLWKEQYLFITRLRVIYDAVEDVETPFLSSAELPGLSIQCEELKLNDDGTYQDTPDPCHFDPNVEVYPRDFRDDESSRRDFEVSARVMKSMREDQKPLNLCYDLDSEFKYPRLNPQGERHKLSSVAHWRRSGYVITRSNYTRQLMGECLM